ncbi:MULTISPECIES: S8 family peptidase [Peribacillus]|uniref:Peptidase S8/S53 subtilisin kexin sedolisin n=2 Tax=Peribacillus TaxID=2675229 RepID=A0AAN2PG25_9BACI|nr:MULTISPECIES: S8 family serine peptidase [Peribacillus]MCP1152537.1 S8 family serine peptidase [Peribacillus frigoritolerans]MCT1391031.1 S8 family serine peptidase [Peribacillus frigoritolerans]CEG31957.1 peptidase S8/S53 subtilisin kexin sedolisin [Peribacillus simplex]
MNFPLKINNSSKNKVKIAILDSGFDHEESSISLNIFKSYDCISFEKCTLKENTKDKYGHGTHISKIIASGTLPNVQLIPIKILSDTGNGDINAFVNGINMAIKENVDIINLSLEIDKDISSVYKVIKKAYDRDIIIVAASGNNGTGKVSYPGKYKEVLSVGSYNNFFEKSQFSQYGKELDFVGPGEYMNQEIENTDQVNNGTSLATAFVTRSVALFYLENDVSSNIHLYSYLKNSVIDLNQKGYDIHTGYGIINVEKLLE